MLHAPGELHTLRQHRVGVAHSLPRDGVPVNVASLHDVATRRDFLLPKVPAVNQASDGVLANHFSVAKWRDGLLFHTGAES